MAKELNIENFKSEVLEKEGAVLVDFWATWCGPCKRQGPIIEALGDEGYNVGKVDVDKEPSLSAQFAVMSIPTLVVFKDGKEIKRFVGLTAKDELEQYLK